MPTTYSYPGVYVEEIKPLSRPIAGVSTSTAGFIGIAEDLTDMPETPKSTEDKKDPYKIHPPKKPLLLTSGRTSFGTSEMLATRTNTWLWPFTASLTTGVPVATWLELPAPTPPSTILRHASRHSPQSTRFRSWPRLCFL